MNVRQMTIEFERSIQLIDEDFVLKDKLDTENMLYFLNIAQERYLKETYLSKGTLQDNTQLLQKRADDLKQLIERTIYGRESDGTVRLFADLILGVGAAPAAEALVVTEDGGQKFHLPYDYIYHVLSRSKITRSTVAVADADWTSNKVITHEELDNVIITPFNDPILRKPCILFEDATSMLIYSDSDTTISDVELIYIRKPKKLMLDYEELVAASDLGEVDDVYTAITLAVVITPNAGGTVSLGMGDTYTVVHTDDAVTTGTVALSYLAFGTNTCELPDYTHQEIVDLAVKIFIEEVKYKLMPNERARRVQEAQARQ